MKRILVIEDEPEMRRNITTILRLEKYEPMSAANGREGLERARVDKPDLILCDVMMPELDGHGVLSSLRANPETVRIPFIFLTAKGEKRDFREGMNLGADDYLSKPVDKRICLLLSLRASNGPTNRRRMVLIPILPARNRFVNLGFQNGWRKCCSGLHRAKPTARSGPSWASVSQPSKNMCSKFSKSLGLKPVERLACEHWSN
jgi:CheY-like chemotaxis protein